MNVTRAKVLIVEDEIDVKDLMLLHVKREGHEPVAVENGEDALEELDKIDYDVVVLDWMLPGVSGLEICRKIAGKMPVLMVTARTDPADIVAGLEAGADDYLTKPFEIPVFLARIRALLRRSRRISSGKKDSTVKIGRLRLNSERHEVMCDEKEVELTRSEFRLLAALMENQGRVLSRQKLIDLVQGEDILVTDRTIDTHVFGLRKKLGPCAEVIDTVRGVGYRVKGD